jgi:lipopolysaccharide exporter
MSDSMITKAGNAFVWKLFQIGTSQTINLARTLILARLLVPEDFGLMSIAIVSLQTILNLTDFGMVPALVQYKAIRSEHYDAAWTIGVLRAAFISLAIFFSAPVIAEIFKEPLATPIIRALAFRPFIEALASIKIAELTRNLNFRTLSFINIPPIIFEMIISISLARLFGVWALVFGALAGVSALVVFSYLFSPYRPRFNLNPQIARPLIQFGRWVFLSKIIAMAGATTLQVIISRQLGAASLGIYYLAIRLAFLPNGISSQVIGEIAFPLYSQFQTDLQKLTKAFHKIFTGMAILLLPFFALLIALAPALTEEVLGSRWIGTDPIIRILALAGMVGLFGDAVGPLFKGIGQPYKVVLFEFIQSLLVILFVWNLTAQFGLAGAASAWFLATSGSQLLALFFIRRQISTPFAEIKSPLMAIFFSGGLSALVSIGVSLLIPGIYGFGITVFLGLAVYAIVLWFLDRSFHLGLAQTFLDAFPQFTLVLQRLQIYP